MIRKPKLALPVVKPGMIRQIFARFADDLRPQRVRLWVSAVALLGESVVTLVQPWPLKWVFDYVLPPAAPRPRPMARRPSWRSRRR